MEKEKHLYFSYFGNSLSNTLPHIIQPLKKNLKSVLGFF